MFARDEIRRFPGVSRPPVRPIRRLGARPRVPPPANKCEDGFSAGQGPHHRADEKRPDTEPPPVGTTGDERICMEDVTWRTTPAPFST
ncbi:hypothetical protein SLA_1770 [Streptomyces laurentii]|uniref:Uncharacterized protein n=1 Tax=Streptomyces laurentii TaxID=39478 RepID=A0A169NAE5_STRLU|nr:hypothetical protein SLA_1770 [Streptomyces laurentii]